MKEKGWIYFLRFGDAGPIKVGRSSDPVSRAYDLSIASPVELVLLGALKSTDTARKEAEFHARLAKFRVRREWFEHDAVAALMKRLGSRVIAADELPATGQRLVGLRADKKALARWTRKAKAAGLSFNKWAHLVLNNAPDVKPAAIENAQKGS
jgi:hypothetical protein